MNLKRLPTPPASDSDKIDPAATRIFMRSEQRGDPSEKRPPFAVVQTLKTRLLPPPASKPSTGNFAAGGTLILEPEAAKAEKPALDKTQHFSAEQLLARRADLEQRLNSELERELGQLSEPEALVASPKRFKAKSVLRGTLMLALLSGTAYLFSLPPDSAPAPAPRASAAPAPTISQSSNSPARLPLPDVIVDTRVTLQRAAADVLAQGRYAEALVLYRRLLEREPNNKAYAEVARILEERLKMR